MILPFTQPISNDNEPPCRWGCLICGCASFVLLHDRGATIIRCEQCAEDVTALVIPTLPIEISLQ